MASEKVFSLYIRRVLKNAKQRLQDIEFGWKKRSSNIFKYIIGRSGNQSNNF